MYWVFMGKVSKGLVLIGLILLVPSIALTSVLVIFPTFIGPSWVIRIVIASVIGFLYIVGFAFMILGLIIMKRDSE
jgi:hypothetical protein